MKKISRIFGKSVFHRSIIGSIHPFCITALLALIVTVVLEPIPVVLGWWCGYTCTQLPVYHLGHTKKQITIHTQRYWKFRVTSLPCMHVCGWGEGSQTTERKPTQGEHANSSQKDLRSLTLPAVRQQCTTSPSYTARDTDKEANNYLLIIVALFKDPKCFTFNPLFIHTSGGKLHV